MPVPDSKVQSAYRVRVPLFLLAVILALAVWVVGSQAYQTLLLLDRVERDRDRWQRPADILRSLDLKATSVVADIGSGAGYFTLKIAPLVPDGSVLAEDILKEPLAFLWIRAHLRHFNNVHVIHGDPDDPHLPGPLDAALIANTYHEFAHPDGVLNRVFRALQSGGRLVIVDRGPLHAEDDPQQHERDPGAVENEVRAAGFEIVSRDDHFIDRTASERPGDRPDKHPWWLIVARKR